MTVCAEQHKSYGRQDYMEVSDESESAAPEMNRCQRRV